MADAEEVNPDLEYINDKKYIGSNVNRKHLIDQYTIDTKNLLGKGGFG